MENRQQCRSKADAAESTPSACRPTTENLAEGKRTELKQILHNESELKKIHCAKPRRAGIFSGSRMAETEKTQGSKLYHMVVL